MGQDGRGGEGPLFAAAVAEGSHVQVHDQGHTRGQPLVNGESDDDDDEIRCRGHFEAPGEGRGVE